MIHIEKINFLGYEIRARDGSCMLTNLRSANSIITFKSIKAELLRDGDWENCILSVKTHDVYSGRLEVVLRFEDGTYARDTAYLESLLSDEDLFLMAREKESSKRSRQKRKNASHHKSVAGKKIIPRAAAK